MTCDTLSTNTPFLYPLGVPVSLLCSALCWLRSYIKSVPYIARTVAMYMARVLVYAGDPDILFPILPWSLYR